MLEWIYSIYPMVMKLRRVISMNLQSDLNVTQTPYFSNESDRHSIVELYRTCSRKSKEFDVSLTMEARVSHSCQLPGVGRHRDSPLVVAKRN